MRRKFFGLVRRSGAGDQRGAAAVEFALVAPVFFALLFSIFEAGYFFFVSSAVDQAAARAGRLIRTGQAQDSGAPVTKQDFFDEICEVVKHFGDCNDRLTVEVESFDDFAGLAASLSAPTCRSAGTAAVNAIPYDPGAERQIVRVRICYNHKTINPGLGLDLAQAADGSRELVATIVFRNEPFSS